jgi:two-component system, OmpR family, response regulator RpaA
MARILIADDDLHIIALVERALTHAGHQVITARTGAEAVMRLQGTVPDLVILDIVMPALTGIDVCRRMRLNPTLSSVPILFLTMKDAIQDKISAFEAGCDDYLTKPFNVMELELRAQALLRHTIKPPPSGALAVGPIRVDPDSGAAAVNGQSVSLTPVEFELLYYLTAHTGEVLPTERLLQEVWGYPPGTGNPSLVRMHVLNLRRKIEPQPDRPVLLRTVPRHGYVLQTGTRNT